MCGSACATHSLMLVMPMSERITPSCGGIPNRAVDATGQSVPTRYQIDGQSLVQVIDFTAATAFPVVADPDFILFARCAAGVALFIAENAAIAGKF